jgi:ABC-type proline/glycine betaine transport systems, ATPase components
MHPMLSGQVGLEFRNVDYAIASGRKLVNGISFEILQGEMLVLLGRSGSGKTTLLKLVNRLLEPTAGEVLVSGRNTHSWDPINFGDTLDTSSGSGTVSAFQCRTQRRIGTFAGGLADGENHRAHPGNASPRGSRTGNL